MGLGGQAHPISKKEEKIMRCYYLTATIFLAVMLVAVNHAEAQNTSADSSSSAYQNFSPTSETNTSAEADVSAYQIFSPTFEGSEQKRNMPGGVLPGHPMLPGYFAQPLMTHEFASLTLFAEMKMEWTEEDLSNWSEDKDRRNVNLSSRNTIVSLGSSSRIKLMMEKPREYEFIGILVANATKADTPSEAVFSVLAQEAMRNGANIIVPLNEGARRILEASGWGVSLGATWVQIGGGNEQQAGVGAAGIGYAKGQSSYRHEPFARVMIARVSPELYARLGAPERPEEVRELEPSKLERIEENNELLRQLLQQRDYEIRQRDQMLHHLQQQTPPAKAPGKG